MDVRCGTDVFLRMPRTRAIIGGLGDGGGGMCTGVWNELLNSGEGRGGISVWDAEEPSARGLLLERIILKMLRELFCLRRPCWGGGGARPSMESPRCDVSLVRPRMWAVLVSLWRPRPRRLEVEALLAREKEDSEGLPNERPDFGGGVGWDTGGSDRRLRTYVHGPC